ncbi:MAG: ABC transporter permease [Planctomycetota bacterium]|jgi:ribose transport system permease protein|nr:ABC transporter permease [Planctomycetota bacterium]
MNKRSPLKTLLDVNGIGIIAVYIVVFAALSLLSPHFLSFSNVMIGLRQAVFTAIVAFAMTFVITMGGIDLSVGSIVGISSMLVAAFLLDGMNIYLSVGLVLCIGAGIGLFNGLVVTLFDIPYFIATLGSMSILRGLIDVYTKGIPLYGLRFPEFRFIGQGYVGVVPTPIIITLGLLAISYYLFYKTRFGRYTVSIGSNEDASRLVGIAVGRIKVLVFMLSGVFCALAGVILASRSEAAIPEAGNAYEMDAIAATVIGGTSMSGGKGNMIGTAFGAILMATIRNGLSLLNVNTFWHQVVIGIFILFAVAFDRFAAKRAE